MSAITPPQLEDYCIAHSVPPSDLLRTLAETTRRETTVPQMQVGPLEGAFLRLLARLTGARRILEIGTFTGYSALCLAEGTPEDGEVVTLDVDPATAAIARRHWDASPHGYKIRSVLGDARQTVHEQDGPFDLVFIDADKTGYATYWDAVVPKVRPGGLLVVDNVLWHGSVLAPDTPDAAAIVAFNAKVRADPRVEPVMLPVRDGMLLAWRRPAPRP